MPRPPSRGGLSGCGRGRRQPRLGLTRTGGSGRHRRLDSSSPPFMPRSGLGARRCARGRCSQGSTARVDAASHLGRRYGAVQQFPTSRQISLGQLRGLPPFQPRRLPSSLLLTISPPRRADERSAVLNRSTGSTIPLVMPIETGSDPRGLWRLHLSPPSRRPAHRGRGVWLHHHKKVPTGPRCWHQTSASPPRSPIIRGWPPPYRPHRSSERARNRATRTACPDREVC